MMTGQQRAGRIWTRLVLILAGIIVGVGIASFHYSGRLAPFYHRLGIHSLHSPPEADASMGSMTGHAGHGGMAMTPTTPGEPSSLPGYSIVTLTPYRQQLIGVRTGKVENARLLMSIRAVGIIEPDQTRLARMHTRISGWVNKVFVNFVGQDVKKNDPLLEIYSPELLQSQLDFLLAISNWEAQGKKDAERQLVDAGRRRLELWGVPKDEIEEVEKTRQARDTLKLRAPINGRVLERNVQEGSYVDPAQDLYRIADLSVVWLQAKIYEYELPHVEIGQAVHISASGRPDIQNVAGKVAFIEPVFQEASRTVKVRVVVDNPNDVFKPGMYVDLVIDHDMGQGLLAPESAFLRTGERVLAFRVLPEHRFEPVDVNVGARFKDKVQVLSGLKEGDEIVTSAGFLIDAESKLKSATGGMSGHQHGGSATSPPPKADSKPSNPHAGHGK